MVTGKVLGGWLLAVFTLLLMTSGNAAAQTASADASLAGGFAGSEDTSAVLARDVAFSLQVVHSVKFPLTATRCYYQFFVDAKGSNALTDVRFDIELAREGRIVGTTAAVVSDLDGNVLSKRIREFAFDGPCALDGIRIVGATGGFMPLGASFTQTVDLIEREAVSVADFERLTVAVGDTDRLPGSPEPIEEAPAVSSDLEQACVRQGSNLRSGPGTEFGVVTVLQPGTLALIEKRTGDGTWVRIRTQFSRQGWVYYTLLGPCPERSN